MGTAPIMSQFVGMDTLGAMAARIKNKVNEPLTARQMQGVYDDIGDALDSIWMSAMLATLSKFTKGPVTQIVANQTTNIISVADPIFSPAPIQAAGGNLGARTVYLSYCLVTDSGSTTLLSPLATLAVLAGNLAIIPPPLNPASQTIPEGVVGWSAFGGLNPDGSDQGQQSPQPLPFNQSWYEPPSGLTQAPAAPAPPSANTTGDNIFAIDRIDVQNQDMTWTNWLQANIGSTWWTQFQHQIAAQTTWTPFVYDFIDNRQLEVRPAPAMPMSAVYFYIHKPRRPRFPQSRLPFTSFACHAFIFEYTMSRTLLGLYEFEAADRWNKYAEDERMRITLQLAQGNWNKDTTVRPFMR